MSDGQLVLMLDKCRNVNACLFLVHSCRSIRTEATSDEMNVVRKFAGHILEKIQEHLVILPNMIVASILLQNPTGIRVGKLL